MDAPDSHTKSILDGFSNVDMFKLKYRQYTETWDHDHCEICGIKIVENPSNDEVGEGYSTDDKYNWICQNCIETYSGHAKWNLFPDTSAPERVFAIEANKNLAKQEYGPLDTNLKGLVKKFPDITHYLDDSDIRSKDEEFRTTKWGTKEIPIPRDQGKECRSRENLLSLNSSKTQPRNTKRGTAYNKDPARNPRACSALRVRKWPGKAARQFETTSMLHVPSFQGGGKEISFHYCGSFSRRVF